MNIRLCGLSFLLLLTSCSPSNKHENNATTDEDDLEIQLKEEKKAQELQAELASTSNATRQDLAQNLLTRAETSQAEAEALLLQEAKLKQRAEEEKLLKAAELAKKKDPP